MAGEGETVKRRYRVVRINPTSVVMEDTGSEEAADAAAGGRGTGRMMSNGMRSSGARIRVRAAAGVC